MEETGQCRKCAKGRGASVAFLPITRLMGLASSGQAFAKGGQAFSDFS